MIDTKGQRPDLLDPALLASLGNLEVVARWVVNGFITGLHRSPRKGFSVEFAEHRAYQPGDDLRYLDWKIAARTDRMVVKQFEAETNLRAMLVVDVSRSMDWRGSQERLTKIDYVRHLAAALALLLLRQRDAVGVLCFDSEVRDVVVPRARRNHWRVLAGALGAAPRDSVDSRPYIALDAAARLLRAPGMIVLFSDLLVDPATTTAAIRGSRALGHDVTVFHVLDRAERELPFDGEAVFTDPESGLRAAANVSEIRDAYLATLTSVLGEWKEQLAAAGAGYEATDTSAPYAVPLLSAFGRREKLS